MNNSVFVISLLLLSILNIHPSSAQYLSSHDRTLPIRISADSLEVKQRDQVAIFTGQVNAQQGDITLRAETLKVYYMGGEKPEQAGQEISRIDAIGEVFFASKGETARSKEGMYDVNNGIITFKGSVVLTQGNNVIRGDHLVLDLETGNNSMRGGPSQDSSTDGKSRVQGLFVPQQSKAGR